MPGAADVSNRVLAAELVETQAERDSLVRLRELAGADDGPMERHGLRCFLICERLAEQRGVEIDRELLLVASILHDIGLYDGASQGGVYVTDGRDFAAELLAGRDGWSEARTARCLDAIERHHELRPQWDAGVEVELLRRADMVELSRGLIGFGAGRAWLSQLWRAVPREGTYREIGKMVLKAARERPASLPRIFKRA
ncbi:MAG TPA: HD domain-containing protein [Solirubrobacterales bacterium]|nr:HD domain-containing protein [Solirubrobacterales bacterium]